MKKKKKKISAVIACYNEGKSIPIMYERLVKVFKKIKVNYEIIFINDASKDSSGEIIKKIVDKDPNVLGVTLSRSFNSQIGFTCGLDISTGDAVVLLDGDLQDPPELIENFYNKWEEGFDIVYGIRQKRDTVWYMAIFYKSFYRVFKKMAYVSVPLDAGDFSLIDRKVIEVLKLFPERNRYLRSLRAWVGFKQIGIPFERPERMFGKTTNSLWRNFSWALMAIFSISYIPLQSILVISILVFLISIICLLGVLINFIFSNQINSILIISTLILFIGSIQLISLSIIGQYIGGMFEEVKARPKYIISSITKNKHSKNS